MLFTKKRLAAVIVSSTVLLGCSDNKNEASTASVSSSIASVAAPIMEPADASLFASQPLITDHFTADPSAKVFNGKLYIYASHDVDTGIDVKEDADKFDMKDYRVYEFDADTKSATFAGEILNLNDIPWASRQLWATDAAEKDGKFFLYFPAKNKEGVFQIGVATSDAPTGPFKAEPTPIAGSFSTDPSVFKDDDGEHYMIFGGIWGGQLQRWTSGNYVAEDTYPESNQPALTPKIAKLASNMLEFAEAPRDVQILDGGGQPILGTDTNRWFFEGAWIHKFNGKYYLSYSTGNTHNIAYAIGDTPYGPFTHKGLVIPPVMGWTTQHSITEHNGKWYLFYHDTQLSNGKDHLRSMKVAELIHNDDGTIQTQATYFK
jgi:hypothetical protein